VDIVDDVVARRLAAAVDVAGPVVRLGSESVVAGGLCTVVSLVATVTLVGRCGVQ